MIRNIISYFDLSEDWQAEARSNLDELAEEAMYLEPDCEYDSNRVLWDLTDCMPHSGIYNSFEYNAVIGISNNSAMLLNIDRDGQSAEIMFV